MSYRTYILEKELAEVKTKLKEVTQALVEVAFSLSDDNFDEGSEHYEVCNTIDNLPDDVQKTYEGLYKYYCAESMAWFNAPQRDRHEQRMQEEYDRLERQEYEEEYAGGHWAIQEDVRDYPDEKTGED